MVNSLGIHNTNLSVPAKHQVTPKVEIKVIKFYKTVPVESEIIGKIQKCQNSTNENHRKTVQESSNDQILDS